MLSNYSSAPVRDAVIGCKKLMAVFNGHEVEYEEEYQMSTFIY